MRGTGLDGPRGANMSRLEERGLIGNCQFAALVSNTGAVEWCCLPSLDSEPVFAALLDDEDGGSFRISPASGGAGAQRYIPNTNVLETTFKTAEGSFRVLDFAPRYFANRRLIYPSDLVRIVEPLSRDDTAIATPRRGRRACVVSTRSALNCG